MSWTDFAVWAYLACAVVLVVTLAVSALACDRLGRRRWLVAALVVAALALVLWRLYSTVEVPQFYPIAFDVPAEALAPERAFVASRDTRIMAVAYGADGRTLYVYLRVVAIDLCALAVRFWPEELLGVTLLAGGLVAWRMWHRPRGEGPHCRHCNYLLVNIAGDRCPECGIELTPRNRVRARRPRWQPAIATVLPLALVAGYALGAARLPRRGAINDWFHWPSTVLYDWYVQMGGTWNGNIATDVSRLVEMDPASGRVLRTLLHTAGGRRMTSLAVSNDRSLLCAIDGERLWLCDTLSGRAATHIQAPALRQNGSRQNAFIEVACSGDGQYVYTIDLEPSLCMWSGRSGKLLRRIAAADLFGDSTNLQPADIRAIRYAPAARSITFVAQRSVGTSWESTVVTAGEDLAGQRVHVLQHSTDLSSPIVIELAAVNGDGSRWYGLDNIGELLAYDLDAGAWLERLDLPGVAEDPVLALSPDGGLLAVARLSYPANGFVEIYATRPQIRLAAIGAPQIGFAAFDFSPRGMMLAAGLQRTKQLTGPSYIAIYELTALRQPVTRSR